MNGWTDRQMDGWIDRTIGCLYVWVGRPMNRSMDG